MNIKNIIAYTVGYTLLLVIKVLEMRPIRAIRTIYGNTVIEYMLRHVAWYGKDFPKESFMQLCEWRYDKYQKKKELKK